MSELTRLPERQAVQRFFDSENWMVLRWALAVATLGAFAGVIATASASRWDLMALWVLAFALDLLLIFFRARRFVRRLARPLLIGFLSIHMFAAVVSLSIEQPEPAYVFAGYLFPASLMVFRLRWQEYLALQLLFLGAAGWFATRLADPSETGARFGLFLGITICALIVTTIAIRLTLRARARFLSGWRHEVAREREEVRMRGELMDARAIQLSMLPRSTPELSWLDASGMSIPANEVGGDYYEYFQLDADRLALVIGDVAGHGVASGLVLSGVRSGLYLMREELSRPVEVIERLNRMVRETAPRRMFVTIQVALIDRRTATVVLANAGHPPVLHLVAGSGSRVGQLGENGLPIGTRLRPHYRETRQELGRGDALVFYTDGVLETHDLTGREFGERRLMENAAKAAGGSARQIRDAILSAVSRFKGDAVQTDDLTLVVLKLEDLGPASR